MAFVFPSTPAGNLPPEVFRAYRFFKSLPDDFVVWHHLAPWEKDAPDFLLINAEKRALLVKVSRATNSDVRPAAQLLLLEDTRPPLGMEETRVLDGFISGIDSLPLACAVLFPNIPQARLAEVRPREGTQDVIWLGQEALQPIGCEEHWKVVMSYAPLDAAQLELLRARFTPEVVVPTPLTVRTPDPRRLEAGLTDYLLDYDQEAALKADLDLPTDRQSLTRDFRVNVLNGVAGSGKTLILLYRLRLLHGMFPGKRFLVLTHNRPLIRDIRQRYYFLTGGLPDEIEWHTFNGWCYHHWPKSSPWTDPLSVREREGLIEAVWRKHFDGANITPGMLRSELDWLKDQVAFDQDSYLTLERRGRGFRLTQEQRQRMLAAILDYQAALKRMRRLDWGDVPRRMLRFIDKGTVALSPFDVILVDEAQFFAPLWFEMIRRLLKAQAGHLFIAADPTQGFLGRGASWRSLGLQVHGHTHLLRRSYRTTREILDFASLFYRRRIQQDDADEDILVPDLLNMPVGTVPQLIPLMASQDEIARVANEIEAFARHGVPLQHILVLHYHWGGVKALVAAIQKRLGEGTAGDPKDMLPGEYVRVTTLNAGTGLESPIVFLVGLNQLFEEEQSLRLSDDEREQLIRENTRKVYMATTRAGQRLVLSYVGELPEQIKPGRAQHADLYPGADDPPE
jgi:superfamily I DNA/RNA helicase